MSKALPKGGSALCYVQGYERPAVSRAALTLDWSERVGGAGQISISKCDDGQRGPELRLLAAFSAGLARHADHSQREGL